MNESAISQCVQCGAELPPGFQACPRCAAGFLGGQQTEVAAETGRSTLSFTPPRVAELAPFIPQLEFIELIGQGGMGAVYKARQKELDRWVALKILPPAIGKEFSFAERFAREAKALARLNHPGIVTLYEFGRAGELFYFLMELVEGINLRQLLNAGRLSAREALAIVPEICDALQFAHDQGLVHRDIKPENILLDRRGRVKVADFGLAKLAGTEAELPSGAGSSTNSSSQTVAGQVVGTPSYMAPEQKERPAEVDARADVYAVGVVFYQMLTGELPVGKFLPPSRKVQIDVRLDEVVLRALERAPEQRYQQVSELKEQVETIARNEPNPAPVDPELPPKRLSSSTVIALWGVLWVIFFFVEYALHFTPAGWKITAAIRPSFAGPVIELLLLAPLTVLGWASPLGVSVLGWAALRQIQQSRGQSGGFGLAIFDLLFFPFLLLNGWMAWLGWQVASQLRGVSSTAVDFSISKGALAIGILLGLIVNVLLVRTAWQLAWKYVKTSPYPVAPRPVGTWVQTLRQSMRRLLLVIVVHFVFLETLAQLSVRARESTSELWDMGVVVATLAGLIWVFWPRLRLRWAPLFVTGTVVISGGLLFGLVVLYHGWIRPNAGLYREPDWVSELPGFQYRYRLNLAKKIWRRHRVGPNFSSDTVSVLSIQNGNTSQLLALATGQRSARTNETGRLLRDWARSQKLDLAVYLEGGQLVVRGFDLSVFPIIDYDEQNSPQEEADYWLFEKNPPKKSTLLWPMEDHWLLERKTNADDLSTSFRKKDGAYLFRTREGLMGVVEIAGLTNDPVGALIRYKRVQADILMSN